MHFERAHTPQKALQIFNDELIKLNLLCRLSFIGSELQTTKCFLLHPDNSIADIGNGKGVGLQSEISAKYEALEHYLSTQKSLLKDSCLVFSIEEIEHKLSDTNKKALPIHFTKKHREKQIPWISMQKFSHNTSMFFPYFLINTDYRKHPFPYDNVDYKTLSDMSTNNGTAIGTTFDEAMLHAVNELIERDAISCFLLATFCAEKPQKIKLIKKDSLSNSISQIIAKIEKDYDEELLIVDISNDLEFPVFLASFTKQKQPIQPMGYGSSLNPEYALERATLEALQSFHLIDENLKLEDAQILKKFIQWPKLRKSAQCDLTSIIHVGNFDYVEFKQAKKVTPKLPESLHHTIKMLENKELPVFFAKHYEFESGISCVKVVIPGIEQFHRVKYGSFAIPGERGQAILIN